MMTKRATDHISMPTLNLIVGEVIWLYQMTLGGFIACYQLNGQ